jgi:serine/threonine-protein kinase
MTENITKPNASSPSNAFSSDVAWHAVIDATQGAYDVLAELARDADGAVAFVATPLAGGDLVVLKLEPEPPSVGGARRYTLFELKKLDDTVPAPRISCPVCAAHVGAWRGSCPACGSAIGAGSAGPVSTEVLLSFYQFVSGRYDVVGELATDGSGPPAYLVRTRNEPQYSVVRLALGGTVANAPQTYVVDILPLARAGGDPPGAPARVPLDASASTAAIATSTTPTAAERVCPQCGATFGGGTLFCPRDGASLRPVTQTSELVGQLIDDRYYVEQRLGEGGMGEVYVAHQVRTGRKCALKLMHRAMTQDPDAVGRFRREAQSACAISHPNVATIFDSGETSDHRPYFAMEFVDGHSLSQLIRDEGRLDPWRAADIGRQIAEGLAAAHDLDIIHRDLKPDNVMLGAARGGADYVKLVDFGIAKPTKTAVGNTLTRTGFILGTPAYMSPEQLCADKLDGRTDLYSLGCVLHEMLTGETPFAGQSLERLMMQRLTEDPPHPRALNDQVPPLLDEIVTKLLARTADERYPDARSAADALGAAQDGMEAPRQRASVRSRGGAPVVRTPTPGPREASSVQVTAGSRPPRRSRDDVPPPPLSPSAPFLSPSLGVARVTGDVAAPTVPIGAPRRSPMRLTVAAAIVVVVGGGAFAAWRLTRQVAPPPEPPAQTTDSSRVAAPPAPVRRDTQPAPVSTNGTNKTPATRVDTPRVSKAPAQKSAPVSQQVRPVAPVVQSAPPTTSGAPVTTQAITTPPRETKVPDAAPPPPVVSESKSKVDAAAEAERAETARVRDAIESYVRAIGAKRMDLLQQIFPSMNKQTRDGYNALFSGTSDLSTQMVVAPSVTVHGATADAEFTSEMKFRHPSEGNVTRRTTFRVKLQRTDQGWIFVTLGAVQ